MIVPGRPILFCAGVLAIALLIAVVEPGMALVVFAVDFLLIGFVLYEGYKLRMQDVRVTREEWARLQLGKPADLLYRIENRGQSTLIVRIRQPLTQGLEPANDEGPDPDVVESEVGPGEAVTVSIIAKPTQRGAVAVIPAEIDIRTSLGLGIRRFSIGGNGPDGVQMVSVFPSLKGMNEYETLRQKRALSQLGIHSHRMRGAGREFDQLREYEPDDNYNDINWKATARRRQLITNMFQAEKSQDLILCLDTGRMMGNPVGKTTALEAAIDASIMLANVSRRQGDRVGLALFGDTVTRFIKPAGGAAAVANVVQSLVGAQASGVFPSYAALASALRVKQNRRALVFVFTDLNDPQLAANMAEVFPFVSRRHFTVIVSLRDPLLERVASGVANSPKEVFEVIAARQLAHERAAHGRQLVKAGCEVLEADADAITLRVVNAYMAAKMRQAV